MIVETLYARRWPRRALPPCPYCGALPEIFNQDRGAIFGTWWVIQCADCDAYAMKETLRAAVEKWRKGKSKNPKNGVAESPSEARYREKYAPEDSK